MSKYLPSHIANYFLWRAWKEGVEITPMKLIKLVYIAYGWNLAINNKQLFDEKILAWEHGPVIPSLYHEFKRFGKNPINKGNYAAEFDTETGDLISVPVVPSEDEDVLKILNAEWENYKAKTGLELSEITHAPDSAWSKVYKNGEGKNSPLEDEDIKRRSLDAITRLAGQSNAQNA